MTYFDDEKRVKYLPFVIEPSLGVERLFLAMLCGAYDEEEIGEGDVRTVLHFHPALPSGTRRQQPVDLADRLRRDLLAAVQPAFHGGV